MKKYTLPLATAAMVASIYPNAAVAQAASRQNQSSAVAPSSPTSGSGAADEQRAKLVDEAVEALRETEKAITSINRNRPNDALAALTRATGKLEIVLARTPTLALAPVDVDVETHDVVATVADVDKVRGSAAAALAQGRLQIARRLISDLASETVIRISDLPLATYPDALKQAAALLHQGKSQDALAVLQATLGTIVVEDVIIPLPLVRAQVALEQTRSLLENDKRTNADSTRMRTLLSTAREQLRLGRALGYATDSEMDDLIATVDDIERKTEGSQSAKGLLNPVGPKIDAARQSSQHPQ